VVRNFLVIPTADLGRLSRVTCVSLSPPPPQIFIHALFPLSAELSGAPSSDRRGQTKGLHGMFVVKISTLFLLSRLLFAILCSLRNAPPSLWIFSRIPFPYDFSLSVQGRTGPSKIPASRFVQPAFKHFSNSICIKSLVDLTSLIEPFCQNYPSAKSH